MTTPLTPFRYAIDAALREAVSTYGCEEEEYDPTAFVAELDRLGYVVMPRKLTAGMEDAMGLSSFDDVKWELAIAAAPKIGGEK